VNYFKSNNTSDPLKALRHDYTEQYQIYPTTYDPRSKRQKFSESFFVSMVAYILLGFIVIAILRTIDDPSYWWLILVSLITIPLMALVEKYIIDKWISNELPYNYITEEILNKYSEFKSNPTANTWFALVHERNMEYCMSLKFDLGTYHSTAETCYIANNMKDYSDNISKPLKESVAVERVGVQTLEINGKNIIVDEWQQLSPLPSFFAGYEMSQSEAIKYRKELDQQIRT